MYLWKIKRFDKSMENGFKIFSNALKRTKVCNLIYQWIIVLKQIEKI
jgi:hypothetical protein